MKLPDDSPQESPLSNNFHLNKKNLILILGATVVLIVILGVALLLISRSFENQEESPKESSPSSSQSTSGPDQTSQNLTGTDLGNGFSVVETGASYKTADGQTSGSFKTGQEADMMLSGIDFNNAGGGLLFNHPGNVASDGIHLILADRNNNRVLIWNTLPTGDTKPDLVLGQKNFITNNPGTDLDQMNWPVGVATDGTRLLIADTYNDRILIWNTFPTQNGQAADLSLQGDSTNREDGNKEITWPWSVWTNGEKMVVTSTGGARVLIWNSFPTQDNQEADILLALAPDFGTPRSIGSDGKSLMIGDHNSGPNNGEPGNFFWKTFPTQDNQPYDFFVSSLNQYLNQESLAPGVEVDLRGDIFWGGTFTSDGEYLILSGDSQLAIWDSFPQNKNDDPDLNIGGSFSFEGEESVYSFNGGDGSSMALAGEKLYISLANGNKIVGFNALPTDMSQEPDFAVGAPNINTDTLQINFIISNPVPASNGQSLFVSSDFDRKLYVWKNLPDESGANPDLVFSLPDGPWDNALWENSLALAGQSSVYIWKTLPTKGVAPDVILKDQIGNVRLNELRGIALDDKYLYLSDKMANKVYIWEGIPDRNSNPKFTLNSEAPVRLSSDGNYLIVTSTEAPQRDFVRVYKIAELSDSAQPSIVGDQGSLNLPQMAVVNQGKFFIADTGFNRLLIWNNIQDALGGKEADVTMGVLGEIDQSQSTAKPQIGKDKLFWPATPCFDGHYLWLGEFKFSERLLRFSPSE